MSSRLEQFINDHREEFDSDAPPKRVWDQLRHQAGDGKNKIQPVIWLSPRRWAVAVALSLLVAGATWFLTHTVSVSFHSAATAAAEPQPNKTSSVASAQTNGSPAITTPTGQSPQTTPAGQAGQSTGSTSPGQSTEDAPAGSSTQAAHVAPAGPDQDNLYREKMGYYANLVRIRHRELGTLEKDEPLLYTQFFGDGKKLDSVYHDLEKQLPDNPNREQLLQGMLQALQLQMKLLNHQLGIIKKINHSKKTAYEKAYKTT
jgi:hypothetical protein